MYWRAKYINILSYLDDLLSLLLGLDACRLMARMVEEDMRLADLTVNWENSDGNPLHERLHLGFVVNLAEGLFKAPIKRWEAFRDSAEAILNAKVTRVQARKLKSLVGTVTSMKIAWGPITQLYKKNLYAILKNVLSLNFLVTVGDEVLNVRLRLRFLVYGLNRTFGLPPSGFLSKLQGTPVILAGVVIL